MRLDESYASFDMPFDEGFKPMKTAFTIDLNFRPFDEFRMSNNIRHHIFGRNPAPRRVLTDETLSKYIEIAAQGSYN